MARHFFTVCLLAGLLAAPLEAGDSYWSEVPGISDVWDLAVCGETVYGATGMGLLRSETLPASWKLVKAGYFTYVACDGNTVLALESAIPDVPWVSHDRGDTWSQVQGLDNEDVRGFTVSGSLALAAVRNGVLVSHDGGDSFSVFPILWSSTNEWNILDVWTDGTQCVAVGEYGSGIFYSASCTADSFSVVQSGSFTWLTASDSTLVAAERYGGSGDFQAAVSHDGGASWSWLPGSWASSDGNLDAHYNLAFVSGARIMGSYADSYLDSGTGQWVYVYEGPFLYDRATGSDFANDLGAGGFPHEAQIRAMAIVERTRPILFAGLDGGALFWYRFPSGWPTGPVDLTPPSPGSMGCNPVVATTSTVPSSVTLTPSASGAARIDILESTAALRGQVYWDGSQYQWPYSVDAEALTESGWMPLSGSLPWTPGAGQGIHFFDAWFADDAGNVTNPSAFSALNVLPGTVSLPEDYGFWTLLWLEAGTSVTVGVSGAAGDADIYHWEPGNFATANDAAYASGVNDTLTFTTGSTGAHCLMIYNWPGSGYLDGTVTVSSSKGAPVTTGPRDNGSGPSARPDTPGATRDGGAGMLTAGERAADANGDGRLDGKDILAILSNIWNGVTSVTTDCSGEGYPDARDLACTIPAIVFR